MALTAKQQAFVEAIAGGATAADAYRAAYKCMNSNAGTVTRNAKRLLKHPEIAPLFLLRGGGLTPLVAPVITPQGGAVVTTAGLLAVATRVQEKLELSLNATIFENAAVAHSDIRRVFDANTGELLPAHAWDEQTARAVKKIKVRALFGEGKDGLGQIGTVTEIELWDKGAALDRQFKHFGGYKEAKKQGVLDGLTDMEVRELYDRMFGEDGIEYDAGEAERVEGGDARADGQDEAARLQALPEAA